jgi:hypothetical protein
LVSLTRVIFFVKATLKDFHDFCKTADTKPHTDDVCEVIPWSAIKEKPLADLIQYGRECKVLHIVSEFHDNLYSC